MVTIDEQYRYVYANLEAERFAGLPRTEFVGRVIFEVFPALRGSVLEQQFTKAMVSRTTCRFDLPFPPHDTWYEIIAHPSDEGGLVVFFHDVKLRISQQEDIDRLKVESDRTRRLFHAVLATTPDFVYVWGPDHKFRYANQALLNLYGVTVEECIGHGFRDVGYPEWHALMHEREIDEVMRTAQPLRGTIPFRGKGGGGIYDYIFVPVFSSDGRVEAVAGITRDVTELDKANKALQLADRRKDEFLATLAHELRNPLAPLRNGIELLAEVSDPREVQEVQCMMQRQVEQMVHLVDDLLDLSRVSRGAIELRRTRMDLRTVVDMAVNAVQHLLEQRSHTLKVEMAVGEWIMHADPTRLTQVVNNVLSNAAKYTPDGGHIRLCVTKGDGSVVISIQDTGIGIAKEDLPRVFDMFSQVEGARKTGKTGLGIGLNIVKRLVEMHDGSITVISDGPGKGSTFTIELPLISPDMEVITPAVSPGGRKARRIMIVDDNVDAAFTLSLMLRKRGHTVHATNGAQEALDVAPGFQPELVLLDIGMPGLNGFEACRRMRNMPELHGTRIIALTGWGQEEDRKRVREAGFDEHLVKPVPLAAIETTIESLGD